MNFKDRKGFTLVEVLAVVAILSLVLVVGGTLVFNMINNAEKESFEVTRNNVLNVARTYVSENKEEVSWYKEDSNIESDKFVCVPINQLINKGLLKKDIKENKELTDYVLVWKDIEGNIISEELDDSNVCGSSKYSIEIPTSKYCNKLTYNNENQNLVNKEDFDGRIIFNDSEIVKKDAGTYTINTTIDETQFHWKDGTSGSKSIICSINKAIAVVDVDKNVINTNDVVSGSIVDVRVTTNISGTLIIKSSNNDYYEVLNKEIKVDKNTITNVSIKILSSKETNGYITITIIPDDEYSKNYYSGSTVVTIGNVEIKKIVVPVCKNLDYNGNEQELVDYREGIIFSNEKHKNIGEYKITAKLRYGYVWDRSNDISDDIELTCSINRPSFTVTYDGNKDINNNAGKTSDGKTSWFEKILYEDNYYTKGNNFNLRGYTFNGWNENRDGVGTSWTDWIGKPWKWTYLRDVILYAQWKPNVYKITYYGNGGISEQWGNVWSNTATYDKKYTVEANWYTKQGYSFVGWTTNSDGTDDGHDWTGWSGTWKYINGQFGIADGELKLYARWAPCKYNITYYNGSTKLGTSTHTYDQSKSLTSWSSLGGTVTDSSYGWSFYGWNNTSSGTSKTYEDGANVKNLTNVCNSNVNLYAAYKRTVTFKSGVNSATSSTATQYWNPNNTSGTSVSSPALAAISNWTALGYRNDTTASSKEKDAGTTITPDRGGSATLYGVYSRTLTVSYNCNGGSSAPSNTTKTVYLNSNSTTTSSQEVTLSSSSCTKGGYTHSKWAAGSASGTTYSKGANYSPDVTYNASTFGKTMYATWNANTYTIKYDCNGGSGSMSNTSATYDSSVTLRSNACSRTGYTYADWNTKQDGTGTSYSNGVSVKNLTSTSGGTVTLFAQWRINKVYVRYHVNGGTITSSTTADDGTKYSWTTADGIIYRNGSVIQSTVNYGATIGGNGLVNWNNSKYIKITKTGQHAKSGSEWNKKTDGSGKSFDQADSTVKASDLCDASKGDCTVVLYVNWTPNTYTVKYSCNGGSGAPSSKTVNYGTTITLASNTCTSGNDVFLGWIVGGTTYSVGTKLKNLTTSNGGTVTISAKWQDKTPPTCSRSVTNDYSSSGITMKFTCSDNRSGCVSSGDTYTNQKAKRTYTCKDNAGNTSKATIQVSSRVRYRSRSCSTCKSCVRCYCAQSVNGVGVIQSDATSCKNYCSQNMIATSRYDTYTKNCAQCGCSTWGSWSAYNLTRCDATKSLECQSQTQYYWGPA